MRSRRAAGQVEHAVDRPGGTFDDAAPVVRLDAGHLCGHHTLAEAAGEVVQRAPVAAGGHDLADAHRQRHGNAGAAEAAGGRRSPPASLPRADRRPRAPPYGTSRLLSAHHRPASAAPETAPPSLLRLLASLIQPAYVTGRRRDLVAWNAAANDIFGFDQLAADERNILVAVLTNPRSRDLFGPGWADEAERMVAQFRATHDLWADDPAFVALQRRLREGCPEFRCLVGAPRRPPPRLRPQDAASPDQGRDRLRPRKLPGQ